MIVLSASQIATWRMCKRKYGFEYIEKIRAPTSDKQQFGIRGHEHMGIWLQEGKVPPETPEGLAARQLIKPDWLPRPGPNVLIEKEIRFPVPEAGDDVELLGFIDCVAPEPLTIIDFKFTTNLRWAKTPSDLTSDPQALVYVKWAFDNYTVDSIAARWLYAAASGTPRRKPRGAKLVEHVFSRKESESKWRGEILSDLSAMAAFRRSASSAADGEPDPRSCSAYGGCPHRERCNLSSGDILAARIKQHDFEHGQEEQAMKVSLAEKLKALTNDQSVEDLKSRLTVLADTKGVNPPLPTPINDVDPAVPPRLEPVEPVEVEKPKRGRPKKQRITGESVKVDQERKDFVVLFDAVFGKNETFSDGVHHLIDILKPVMDQVANDNDVEHWGLVDFAKGGPMLAAKFEKLIEAEKITGVILADSWSNETKAVKEVLRRRADAVIHGVK